MNQRRVALRRHISTLLARKGDEQSVVDDESLVLSGRLDSFSVVDIVVFVEDEFGTDFGDYAFDQDDFDTIDSILALVQLLEG